MLDNILAPVYFEEGTTGSKEALETILRALLDDPSLIVDEYRVEMGMFNIGRHGARVDVWARDGLGRQMAVELQKETGPELYPRAAFEGAAMLVHSLEAGEDYIHVDKTIVIFITPRDLEGKGKAVYLHEVTSNGKPSGIE